MKVHFATSANRLDEYKDNYLLICQLIKQLGHEIVHDWIEDAILKNEGKLQRVDKTETYRKVMSAINEADVLIVEGSIDSFSVGHQATVALQKEKPVLFLAYKAKKHKNLMLEKLDGGIKNSLVMKSEYSLDSLRKIMDKFFKLYKGGGKFRFNLLLDRDVRDYLNWAARHGGKTRSEIIRHAVMEEAKKNREYTKQLTQ